MFNLVLADVDLLKNTVPIIAEIIDEGIFKIDQNGVSLLAPDRTMVSVVDFRILSTAFEKYSADGENEIGLNMASFTNILKRIKSSETLTLDMPEANRLRLTVEGNGKRVFEIPILDVKMEKPPVDQLNFTGRVELSSSIIEDGISDADIIGDSVILEAGPNGFKMYAKGDVSSAEMEMKKGDKGILKIETQDTIKARYPLDYLKKMIKAAKLSKNATIEFGTDYPMRVGFKSIDKMQLSFILAPRVED